MSAGAFGRRAAAFKPCPLWVTTGLAFGDDDARDGDTMATWCDVVGDGDMVWILGGLGDPDYLDGLPGRKYLLAGPGDPCSVHALVPNLAECKLARSDGDERASLLGHDAVERQRAELAADIIARGGLAWCWTGWGAKYDPHRSILRPRILDSIIIRGRALSPHGRVDGTPLPPDPLFHRLEDA